MRGATRCTRGTSTVTAGRFPTRICWPGRQRVWRGKSLAKSSPNASPPASDISYGKSLPRQRGEGHAFGFVHRRLLGGGTALPIVPLVVNTYYPPNQPRPARCYALGRALREAIETFSPKKRIGVIASGGLSHFTVDEELDRNLLSLCREGDEAGFAAIPAAKLNSGSSEIRNWIVTAGAAEGLRTKWQEYVPLYRTPAGTGCGMAFAEWG
jgi:3-O-methylgallate 3,4-dioxygenase